MRIMKINPKLFIWNNIIEKYYKNYLDEYAQEYFNENYERVEPENYWSDLD